MIRARSTRSAGALRTVPCQARPWPAFSAKARNKVSPTYFVSLVTGHQLILQSAKRNSTATDRSRFCIDCVTNRRVHTTSRDSICFVRGIVSNWIERAKWQATVKQQPAAGWVLLSVVGIKFCKSCLSWMSVGSLTAMWREITSLSNISVISRSTAGCYL